MSDGEKAGFYVGRKIRELAASHASSSTRAKLALLRRGVGKQPGSMPEIWDATFLGIPESLMGKGRKPSYGEWAIHTSLTLFALHQQGKDLDHQCMNQNDISLGSAIRRLVKKKEDENRIKRRFDAAATSDNLNEFSHHLRGLVKLLKASDIPLDYTSLTKDLYLFQFEEVRDSVRLRWGRDFYSFKQNDDLNEDHQSAKG